MVVVHHLLDSTFFYKLMMVGSADNVARYSHKEVKRIFDFLHLLGETRTHRKVTLL